MEGLISCFSSTGSSWISLNITNSKISGNQTIYGKGGGIYARYPIHLTNSSVDNNSASNTGGGIESIFSLYINNSTINDNSAPRGGAICHPSNTNSTFSCINSKLNRNTAYSSGGALFVSFKTYNLNNSEINNKYSRRQRRSSIYYSW